jgi:hypothetical protein
MNVMWRNVILAMMFFVLLAGCGDQYHYNRLVEEEIAGGVRHDSLFLGISFGMTQKDFYTHCWNLNKAGLVKQGPGNATVQYIYKDLKEPAEMNFYPAFYKGMIWKMPVKYNYESWAPWNTQLSSDSLVHDLVHDFEKIYGKKFIEVNSPKAGKIFYTVEGNRKISIYKGNNDKDAWAIFTDLITEKEIKKNSADKGSRDIKGSDSL